ncbi:hypothetical protein CVT26_013000 [Gymnopilus dilepis]|uniref:Uncharacterized protein n=1 Tax=Gymnopilus dilepis TaxID=231916 RepID=A0A409X0H5_9AGAR|nr:hypothetical protein CVT26_013000 [Gymnopilus dilepis]
MDSLSTFDTERYMQCPGPRIDGQLIGVCPSIIPKVIVCTGPNAGKSCQRCDTCGYFTWLVFENGVSPSPNSKAFSSNRVLTTPALSPSKNTGNDLIGGSWGSQAPGFSVPPYAGSGKSKPRCPCGRQGARSCTKLMCKSCCKDDTRSVCLFKNHNNAENERRIKHTVLLVAYLQDAAEPTPLPLQDIKTWPTLNLAHLPQLAARLGLESFDNLELYVQSSYGNFWIPTVDHSMTVKTEEKIYIRRKGVQTGLHQSFLSSLAPPPDTPRPGPFQTPTRKRTRELTPPSTRRSKIPHIDLTLEEPASSPSPPVEPLSPSPTPAVSRCCTPLLSVKSEVSYDQLRLTGSVLTPSETNITWPNGIYACDMAWALDYLAGERGDLGSRFSRVFNGIRFTSSTYHKNRRFWEAVPPLIKAEARSLPRNDEGLWTVWRKKQPGWN